MNDNLSVFIYGTIFFIGFYLIYYLICVVYTIKDHQKKDITLKFSNDDLPYISMIIPVYNEIKIIDKKFENLKSLNYPLEKLEAVFVDGGSTDGSADRIDLLSNDVHFTVKTIRQGSRKGFNNAVIEGFQRSIGQILFITGAETEYDPNALRYCIEHYEDPKVGVVTGRQIIKNVQDGSATKVDYSYRKLFNFVLEAECKIDTPTYLQGEISSTRREVLQRLVEMPEFLSKGNIDSCYSFQARLDDLKTIYEPRAVYYELSPKTFRDSWKQQLRRSATMIQNIFIFKNMMLRSKYGLFGLFIMPSHMLILTFLPFLFIFDALGILLYLVFNPNNVAIISFTIVGLVLTIFSRTIQAFIQVQIILVLGNIRLLTGIETQKFMRIESTRPKK